MPDINEESLRSKIDATQKAIQNCISRRKTLEVELALYTKLLQEVAGVDVVTHDKKPTVSEAIIAFLKKNESATTTEMAQALVGTFRTTTKQDPRTAIYAAIAALKDKRIEAVSGDSRRYKLKEESESEEDADVQQAASI